MTKLTRLSSRKSALLRELPRSVRTVAVEYNRQLPARSGHHHGLNIPHFPMNLCDLEECEVLSITLDQNHLCFEMVLCAEEGARYKLSAWSTTGTSLDVKFGALILLGHRTDSSNHHTLGELERVSMAEDVLTLEGDFGDIVIHSAATSIEQLK